MKRVAFDMDDYAKQCQQGESMNPKNGVLNICERELYSIGQSMLQNIEETNR